MILYKDFVEHVYLVMYLSNESAIQMQAKSMNQDKSALEAISHAKLWQMNPILCY